MSKSTKVTAPETVAFGESKYIREDLVKHCEASNTDGLKYAIVRSRDQGVMAGYVESILGQTVVLKLARQIWRYDSRFVLSDMAEFGVRHSVKCKFSAEMSQPAIMLEACGVLYCTKNACDSIRGVPAQSNA